MSTVNRLVAGLIAGLVFFVAGQTCSAQGACENIFYHMWIIDCRGDLLSPVGVWQLYEDYEPFCDEELCVPCYEDAAEQLEQEFRDLGFDVHFQYSTVVPPSGTPCGSDDGDGDDGLPPPPTDDDDDDDGGNDDDDDGGNGNGGFLEWLIGDGAGLFAFLLGLLFAIVKLFP